MKKIIITESQFKKIKKHLLEVVKPEEVNNHKKGIQSVIDGRRDVGFLSSAIFDDLKKVDDANLEIIPIGKNRAYVFYNKKGELAAKRLADIAIKNDGYLPIKDPKETYEIGLLLGYDEDSVKDFVLKNFPDFKF